MLYREKPVTNPRWPPRNLVFCQFNNRPRWFPAHHVIALLTFISVIINYLPFKHMLKFVESFPIIWKITLVFIKVYRAYFGGFWIRKGNVLITSFIHFCCTLYICICIFTSKTPRGHVIDGWYSSTNNCQSSSSSS